MCLTSQPRIGLWSLERGSLSLQNNAQWTCVLNVRDEQTLNCEDVTLRNGLLNVFFFSSFLILGVYLQIAPSSLCHKLHLRHLQNGYSKARTLAMATE